MDHLKEAREALGSNTFGDARNAPGLYAIAHALIAIAERLPAPSIGPILVTGVALPLGTIKRDTCSECGENIYRHADAPWLHVSTGVVWCYRNPESNEVARPEESDV